MYTVDSAYVTFEEHLKGSLEVGKLADLIVLDRDSLRCREGEIKDTRVLATMLEGTLVHGSFSDL
jgi:predicted amidohydrolase YtcJ